MKAKTLTIGIMPLAEYQARSIRIAKGEYKPAKGEPKVFFPSVKALSQLLSEENQKLLQMILETHPNSIVELAQQTGRAQSNLSRTLKKLSHYGIVSFEKHDNKSRPIVEYTDFDVKFGLHSGIFA
ncbi:MAG: transcriptional regulator [bacterium]|nr:transcriptional regulator [bacterium]